MTSSPKRGIIRGAEVMGTVVFGPDGYVEVGEDKQTKTHHTKDASLAEEHKNLKALEDFWYQKGLKAGEQKGFEEGWKEGDKKGYIRGVEDGKKIGFQEGEELGKEEGLNSGYEKAHRELIASIELVNKMANQLAFEKEEFLEKIKPEMIRLSMAVCENILRRELQIPESLTLLIERLLLQVKPIIIEGTVNVFLSPEDLDMIESYLDDINYDKEDITKLNFSADSQIKRGDLRLETDLGIVNFDVERQVKELQVQIMKH